MSGVGAEGQPRFEMRGIHKSFGATVALENVDFAVAPGEVCGLVGENGAGKSTLMAILSGALVPDRGDMVLEGAPYAPKSPLDARRGGVAMIYQELSLAPDLSAADNILLGVEPRRFGLIDHGEIRQRAGAALEELGRADIPVTRRVGDLSVAEQQLVEIARAIAVGCRVLVLDEPTSTLGRQDTERLFQLIARLKANGHAIVYISHFIEEVREVCDRIVVLRDGRVAGGGPATMPQDELVRLMVGRQVEDLFPRSPRERSGVVLEVESLFPGSATFTLHRGEIFGIAGLVGAGRTTLLRSIVGLEPVRSGRVRVGAYVGPASPAMRWAQGVGMVSEDRKGEGVALGLSVAENLTLTRLTGMGPAGLVTPSRQRATAAAWIRQLAIKCQSPAQMANELSGGNQQKVAIARLLHHEVDVLVLDEPTRGIDIGSKAQIYALIDSLVSANADGRSPRSILLVSSYLPELLGLCDRIAVMCRGRLGEARPVAEWNEHRLMLAATGSGAVA
jgi:ribose transport system ATP-binding protein